MARHTAHPQDQTFEAALERLEHIVSEMEGDKLALEDLLARYEEGNRLVKVCQDRLAAAEKRIELISRDAAGVVELKEFSAQSSAQSASSPAASVPAPRSAPRKSPEDDISLF